MPADRDNREFTPPPFSFALTGHLMTGLVKAVVIALVLWLLGLTGVTTTIPAGAAILTAAAVMIVIELCTAGVERIFVLRHRHPDPGSVPMTVIVTVLPLPIGVLVGLLAMPTTSGALLTMAVTAAVYWIALVALERPWAEGDTQADTRRKYDETKAMTRDQFRSQ